MNLLQFLTSKEFGCCTTGELMAFNKADKAGYLKLREWGEQEMKNRGMVVEEVKPATT